jgi:capsular exopolysaccharide synthesis family protein
MSRTYEALRRAANGRLKPPAAPPPTANGAPAPGRAPAAPWAADSSRDVEYQRVRVWLTGAAARGQAVKTVLVVGCRSGAGATTTSAALARTLSEGQRLSVLVIDANFRTPAIGAIFDARSGDGLGDVLHEGLPLDRGVRATGQENLSVLPSGRVSRVPAAVFEGVAIDQFLAEVKQRFDFVIIDGAPVLAFPDAHALAAKVDGLILVVEADKTSVDDALRARRVVEEAGGRVLGVILNRQRDYTPRLLRRVLGTTG